MAIDEVSYSSQIVIQETQPARGGNLLLLRKVTLQGATLPLMGASWATEATIQTTWYPGNSDDATQQILGAKEMPSTWTGEWHRTMMGREPAEFVDADGSVTKIISPHVLYELFRSILRAGNALIVTWATRGKVYDGIPDLTDGREENYEITRTGRLKNITPSFDRHTDINWSMTFDWSGTGLAVKRVASVTEEGTIDQSTRDIINNGLNTLLSLAPGKFKTGLKPPKYLTLGQLETIAKAPLVAINAFQRKVRSTISDFRRAVGVAARFVNLPSSIANATVNLAQESMTQANRVVDELGRIPTELMSNQKYVIPVVRAKNNTSVYQDESEAHAAIAYNLDQLVRAKAFAASNTGQLTGKDIRPSGSSVLAIHICKAGDTPNSVALKYLGNADLGRDILQANRLPWHLPTLSKGQILVIPVAKTFNRGA